MTYADSIEQRRLLTPENGADVNTRPSILDVADTYNELGAQAFAESDGDYGSLTREEQRRVKTIGVNLLQGVVDGITYQQNALDDPEKGNWEDSSLFRKATADMLEYAVEVIGIRPTEEAPR